MPTQFKTAASAAAQNKILSFYEEALFITSIGVGGALGTEVMEMGQAIGKEAPTPFLLGSAVAVLSGVLGRYIIPASVNYVLSHDRESLTHEDVLTPHSDRHGRLMGWFTGAAMAAVAYTGISAALAVPEPSNRSATLASLGETHWQELPVPTTEARAQQPYVMTTPISTGFGVRPAQLVFTSP